jgi:hypothetical protein
MPKSTLTDKQIVEWVQLHREKYAAGTLRKWQIERLERIPGWSWTPESVEHATKAITKQERKPSQTSAVNSTRTPKTVGV